MYTRVPSLIHNITLTLQGEVERYNFDLDICAFSQNSCVLASLSFSMCVDWFHAKIVNEMKPPPGIILLADSGSGVVEQAHSLNRMLRKLKSWKLE